MINKSLNKKGTENSNDSYTNLISFLLSLERVDMNFELFVFKT